MTAASPHFPDRRDEFRAAIATGLEYASATGTPRLHLMAGAASGPVALASYRDSIKFTCEAAAKQGIDILIEPINNNDIPGYLMNDFGLAERLIAELNLPNFWLQFDIYHRQRIHGEVTKGLEALLPITRHMQIASAPFRREPTTGELDDRHILRLVERLGYTGYIGCEYGPAATTLAGLILDEDSLARFQRLDLVDQEQIGQGPHHTAAARHRQRDQEGAAGQGQHHAR